MIASTAAICSSVLVTNSKSSPLSVSAIVFALFVLDRFRFLFKSTNYYYTQFLKFVNSRRNKEFVFSHLCGLMSFARFLSVLSKLKMFHWLIQVRSQARQERSYLAINNKGTIYVQIICRWLACRNL